MVFTPTPLDGSASAIPMSSAVPDGTNTPLAVEGGPGKDTGGNTLAPVAVYQYDGYSVVEGSTTDTAVVGDVAGTNSAKFRGFSKIWNDVWDSVIHRLYTADIETANYITASTPPTVTSVGSDTPYTFSSQANRIIIQNNTSANVYYAFDTAASLGSLVLLPGSMLVYPKKCTVLHLYTAATQNINGTAVGNIVVLGAN